VTYSNNNNRRYEQTGIYLQDEMVWERWHLDVSGRYDRLVSQQVSNTFGTSSRRADGHISGRASLLYALENGLSPYLSYSQAITQRCCRAPTERCSNRPQSRWKRG
jgi:iron complex outermembrane receptor protein